MENKAQKNFGISDVLIITGIVLISLIIGFLAWCVTFNIRGRNALENGDYVNAASFAEKNVLFGKELADDSLYAKGQDLYKKKNYEEAEEAFSQLGDRAYDEWADCVFELAERMPDPFMYDDTWEQDYQEKIDAYQPIADEERAKEKIAFYTSEMAYRYYYEDQKETALNLLESIEQEYGAVCDEYNDTYYMLGNDFFGERDMEKAKDCYLKTNDEEAKSKYDFILLMEESKYEEAARAIVSMRSEYGSSEYDLENYMEETVPVPANNDIDAKLNYNYIFSIFDEESLMSKYSEEGFTLTEDDIFIFLGEIGTITTGDSDYLVESLNSVCASATNPSGKILVLRTQYSFPKDKQYVGIDFDLMEKIPACYYPKSLSEVEYIVIVDHDFYKGATYSGNGMTLSGLVSTVSARAVRVDGVKNIYQSGTVTGRQPSSTSMVGTGTDGTKFVYSHAPDYSGYFWKALKTCMNAIDNG